MSLTPYDCHAKRAACRLGEVAEPLVSCRIGSALPAEFALAVHNTRARSDIYSLASSSSDISRTFGATIAVDNYPETL